MDWNRHKAHWPNAEHSTFVASHPHHWHVQRIGSGPTLLLLHGAGASTHSWAPLIDRLGQEYEIVAIDLPGQGFTKLGSRNRSGLKEMTEDILHLLTKLDIAPHAIIGHSAGAAIAVSLVPALKKPPLVISINGAFESFDGIAGLLFPAIAKVLSINPATGFLFSRMTSSESRIRSLIGSTGSHIPARQIECYHKLVRDPDHVNAALAMMAQWTLKDMPDRLADLTSPVYFLIGENDKTVPPTVSQQAAKIVPNAQVKRLIGLGHLMHEENPSVVASAIKSALLHL